MRRADLFWIGRVSVLAALASVGCANSPVSGDDRLTGEAGAMAPVGSTGGSSGETTPSSNDAAVSGSLGAPKTVFLTSTTYKGGALGGLDGADAKCQARAVAAGLAGTYRAWLSDSTGSPSSRFTRHGAPYALVNGSVVANDWAGLTSGSLRHAINVTELGGPPPTSTTVCGGSYVWTDTDASGQLELSETCGDWSDVNGDGTRWGLATSQVVWTSSCTAALAGMGGCGTLAPLYCFQQ
jgi:Collagenase NC10 and Endostatin